MSSSPSVSSSSASSVRKALVFGVGGEVGLGASLARLFAQQGKYVIVTGRTLAKIELVVQQIVAAGGRAVALQVDVSQESQVQQAFEVAMKEDEHGAPADLVVFNAGNFAMNSIAEISVDQFESLWRVNTLGGLLVARESAKHLTANGVGGSGHVGTVIFTGATASLRGAAKFAHFGATKAGLRAIAQAFAREYNSKGIHVAHVIVDGIINGERVKAAFGEKFVESKGPTGTLSPDDIAQTYWHIYTQKPSAWTFETDIRPQTENF